MKRVRSVDVLLCAVLFLLALAPRLLWALYDATPPFSDMEDYYLCAVNFLKGEHLAQSPDRLAYRAPGYPLFLAVWIQLFSTHHLLVIKIVQALIGSASAVVLYWVAKGVVRPAGCGATTLQPPPRDLGGGATTEQPSLGSLREGATAFPHPGPLPEGEGIQPQPGQQRQSESRRPGGFRLLSHPYLLPFGVALAFALLANHVFFVSVLMSETLDIFCLLCWVLLGLHCRDERDYKKLCVFSVLLGMLALIRPVSLFLLPLVLWKIFTILPRPQWPRRVWLPLAGWLLPILPWTIRNFVLLQAFVLISSNTGVNFFLGHNPTFGYYASGLQQQFRQEYERRYGINEVGEDRYLFSMGMDYANERPGEVVTRSLLKLIFLYLLPKEPWPWEEYNGGAGMVLPGRIDRLLLWWSPYLIPFCLLGIAYAWRRRLPQALPLGVIGLTTAAHVIFFAQSRFRMPMEPFLLLYAGIGLASLVDMIFWGYGRILGKAERQIGIKN